MTPCSYTTVCRYFARTSLSTAQYTTEQRVKLLEYYRLHERDAVFSIKYTEVSDEPVYSSVTADEQSTSTGWVREGLSSSHSSLDLVFFLSASKTKIL